jgi:ABC-type sugar transport system permease subunit
MSSVTAWPPSSTASATSARPRRGPAVLGLPYLLLLPSLALILIIEFYPFMTGISYSLHKGSLLGTHAFVGLQNYARLFNSSDFYHSLYFSFLFALFNVGFSYLIGLGMALLLNLDFPGRGLCRVFLLIPWIVPAVVSIVSWKWLIADRGGLVNIILDRFGCGPIYFLSDSNWAMVAVIVIKIWRSFPFMMLSLLAQIQVIDRNLYEAAKLDGANHWESFWYITLPHLKNISIVQAILMIIWSINDFETPYLLTQGGPSNATENLILLSYRYTFGRNDVGRGSAVALLTLVLLMILACLMLRQQRKIL